MKTEFDAVPVTVHMDADQLDEVCVAHLKNVLFTSVRLRKRGLLYPEIDHTEAYLTVLSDLLRGAEFDSLMGELDQLSAELEGGAL